jgi:hypothetical protein
MLMMEQLVSVETKGREETNRTQVWKEVACPLGSLQDLDDAAFWTVRKS